MMRLLFIVFSLAVANAASAEQPLGRLFFTPAERAQLDEARTHKQRSPQSTATEPVASPATQTITYSGIVRRSDGKSILWLNNRAAEEKEALAGLAVDGRVGADGAVTLQDASGSTVRLKVGQRAELQTGKVAEARHAPPASLKNQAAPTKQQEDRSGDKKNEPTAGSAKTPVAARTPESREDQRLSAGQSK
jgi:hypothetical protein